MRHSDCWLRGKLGGCHLLMLLLKVFFPPPPALQSTAINPALGEEEPWLQLRARGMGTAALPLWQGRIGLCWGWQRGQRCPQGLLAALGV